MTDHTVEILRLQQAREELAVTKAAVRARIKAKYNARIADEIQRETAQAELEFAHLLKQANDRGVPQSLLRLEVLRTNTWSRWTYWRDLAQIEPDRITVANAKQARKLANLPYRWDAEARTITWLKGPKGEPLREEVIFGDLDPDERSGYQAVVRSHNNGKVIVDAYGTSLSKFLDLHVVPVMREVL